MDFAVSAAIRAVDKFSSIFNRMGVNVGKFGSTTEGAFSRANKSASLFKTIFGANLVSGFARDAIRSIGREIRQLPQVLTEFTERADVISKTSRSIGVTAEAFQRLSYAAKLSNVEQDQMVGAFQKLNNQMGQMKVGTGTLVSIVGKLNPQLARQLRTVDSTENAFLLVSEAVKQATTASNRAAIAQAAFGRSGQELLPMLLEGREGIRSMMLEADKYGNIITDKVALASEDFNDTLTRIRNTMTGVKDKILATVMTGLMPYVKRTAEWVAANKDLIATRIEQFIDKGTRALQVGLPILRDFFRVTWWIVRNWPLLAAVYVGWTGAQVALNVALDANPIGGVVIAIEAMIVAVILVIHYWEQITTALRVSWNWFNKLFGNPWIRVALTMIAQPLLVIVSAIQFLVDLLSGRGLGQALSNFLGPWKALTDAAGWTRKGGQWEGPVEAPNEAAASGQAPSFRFINQVNVDNSRAPGTRSAVHFAPALEGAPGYQ